MGKVKSILFTDTPNENMYEDLTILCKRHKTEVQTSSNITNEELEEAEMEFLHQQEDKENV